MLSDSVENLCEKYPGPAIKKIYVIAGMQGIIIYKAWRLKRHLKRDSIIEYKPMRGSLDIQIKLRKAFTFPD
jgi:hypothetical protein